MSSKGAVFVLIIAIATLALSAQPVVAQTTGTASYGLTVGSGYNAAAAGTYIITYQLAGISGAALTITVSGATQIRLGLIVAGSTTLASGWAGQTAAVDVGAGYTLQLSNSVVATDISLTTSTTGAAFQALLTASTKAAVLQVDASSNVIASVPCTYSTTTKKFTLTLPSVGNYLFVSQTLRVSLNAGSTAVYYANATDQTFAWASGVAISFVSRIAATITMTYSTTHTAGTDAAANFQPKLGVYAVVTVNGPAADQYTAQLDYTYTDSQLSTAGVVNANTLHWAVYSTTDAAWRVPTTGGSVNTNTKVVSQTTATFSEWGIYFSAGLASAAVQRVVLALSVLAPMLLAALIF